MVGYYLVLDILLVLYEFSCNSDLVINSGLFCYELTFGLSRVGPVHRRSGGTWYGRCHYLCSLIAYLVLTKSGASPSLGWLAL